MPKESQTCFSLIEKLEPLFKEYGEEQIVVALAFCIQREFVNSELDYDQDTLDYIQSRINDLDSLEERWVKEYQEKFNPPTMDEIREQFPDLLCDSDDRGDLDIEDDYDFQRGLED